MPEGDSIRRAANSIQAALVDKEIADARAPNPRHAGSDWVKQLPGRRLERAEARGKHLLLYFDEDLVIHSHLRTSGAWHVYERGARWRRSRSSAWLILSTEEHEVVQFGGPILELISADRARRDLRLAKLGPDILHPDFDVEEAIASMRARSDGRTLGDILVDQNAVAGIGNIWKSEGCFAARIDPWAKVDRLTEADLRSVLDRTRSLMQQPPSRSRPRAVYRRAGRPCPSCDRPITSRGQGDHNRTTYWCRHCQA